MPDCSFWQIECNTNEAVKDAARNVVETWGRSTLEGLDKTLTHLGTFWVDMETTSVNGEDTGAYFVHGLTAWMAGAIAVGSLISAGIMVMWHMRGEQVKKVFAGVLRMVIVSGTCFLVADLLIDIADDTSAWMISKAVDGANGDFAKNLLTLTKVSPGATGWILIILGAILGIIANIIQIMLMLARDALLPLVVGLIPLAAAAATTDWGRQWLNKLSAWTISFIMMKPAAALVYATAIKMVAAKRIDPNNPEEQMIEEALEASLPDAIYSNPALNLNEFFRGIALMILAALAMPALIRLITPAIDGIGGSGGGAAAVLAGAGALATGAVNVARSGDGGGASAGSSGSSGAQGGEGPSGADGSNGGRGSPGASGGGDGPTGAGGGATGGGATASGSGGAASGGGAGGGAAGGGAAGASGGAAAGGPWAAVAVAGAQVGASGVRAARGVAEESADSDGPSGAQEVSR